MYIPKHFEENRVEVLHRFIQAHPFGALVVPTMNGLEANHLPFELGEERGRFLLRGHVARANPLWREVVPHREALVIFQGPHAYITPSWYPSKAEGGKAVPTWNYAVVHAHGPLRIHQDREWLRAHLERLTRRHESGRDDPWEVADAPADFLETLIGAVVGIELEINRLVGKWKLSQNRAAPDIAGVISGLAGESDLGAKALAEFMGAIAMGR